VTEVRKATKADLPALCDALRRAFWDDPITAHLLPEGASGREKRLATLMRMEAGPAIAQETVFTTTDGDATAIWKAPGKWKIGGMALLRQMPVAISAFRGQLPKALATLTLIEKKHPTEPHWYLAVLGAVPEAQGKGKGSAAMQPVLDHCDHEGLPAYLESSKHKNVPFYERHGFKVTEEIRLPNDGPPVWLMWRDPR